MGEAEEEEKKEVLCQPTVTSRPMVDRNCQDTAKRPAHPSLSSLVLEKNLAKMADINGLEINELTLPVQSKVCVPTSAGSALQWVGPFGHCRILNLISAENCFTPYEIAFKFS